MGEVMETLVPIKLFKSVDLPTLGRPTRTTTPERVLSFSIVLLYHLRVNLSDFSQLQNLPLFNSPIFPLLLVWSLIWKGLAMWRAAKNGEKAWFVFLFLINTFGILDIIYLVLTRPERSEGQEAIGPKG